MAREYVCLYHSYLKSVEPLNDAERGRLFTACLTYSMTGAEPDLRGNERFVWPTIREQIDRDTKKYSDFCKKQQENIRKRWDTTVYDGTSGIPEDTKHTKEKEKEKEPETILSSPNVEDSIARTPARKRFTPPTLAEVTAYCRERQNAVDPQRFIDYYTANGWKVGKNSMKDWKAAVRTWEGKQRDTAPAQRSSLDETRAVLRRIAGGTP